MDTVATTMVPSFKPVKTLTTEIGKTRFHQSMYKSFLAVPINFCSQKLHFRRALVISSAEETASMAETEDGETRFKWVEVGPDLTEAQKEAISQLSPKMTKRRRALMKQLICFSPHKATLSELLVAWVRIMKPRRADWLAVLKQLKAMDHPLYLEVAELALLEESFEANIRDYTKIIHSYGKQNRLKDAEKTLVAMKSRGFFCDQVTLTTFIHMYSKAGKLELAEETFEELKLLGEPLDKRSYGSMIMAYIRAGMPDQGEVLLREMDAQEIYAGREVYKALLREYSMKGDAEGAQRVFDAIQLAVISPDAKLCGLLINAYGISGQSQKALVAFENMRRAGIEPSDKCIALVLSAYEKENKLQKGLEFLIDLENDGIIIGKEASETLVGWFRKLGVVKEVDLVLREYALKEANSKMPAN
ncbi:Tetratricopeptide-like helical domain containing protein [Trema orientale]|uniref:Tetratricopeptide-like helical domain containing protein n=1 Tax=Trema orientale TaxID=63057 RepID=A0A2P5B061_TREOI|nr:Tetratricopeptide-like helical domain containing protein [Trema orientale]